MRKISKKGIPLSECILSRQELENELLNLYRNK